MSAACRSFAQRRSQPVEVAVDERGAAQVHIRPRRTSQVEAVKSMPWDVSQLPASPRNINNSVSRNRGRDVGTAALGAERKRGIHPPIVGGRPPLTILTGRLESN